MPLRHRSVQNHGLFFITTSTYGRVIRFITLAQYNIVLEKIEIYRQRDNASIHGFVVMPNHLHLLMSIPEGESISAYMRDLKKRVAFEYAKLEGLRSFPFWQERFDDVNIYSNEVYSTKLNYIHNNPVRAKLVRNPEDWLYSSASFYLQEKLGIITINPISIY